jgi:hypothetical protein
MPKTKAGDATKDLIEKMEALLDRNYGRGVEIRAAVDFATLTLRFHNLDAIDSSHRLGVWEYGAHYGSEKHRGLYFPAYGDSEVVNVGLTQGPCLEARIWVANPVGGRPPNMLKDFEAISYGYLEHTAGGPGPIVSRIEALRELEAVIRDHTGLKSP